MTEENVIDLKSRKPYQEVRRIDRKKRRQDKRRVKTEADAARQAHREAILSCLRQTTKLVEEGRLEGLIILSREPTTKLFLTDVVIDQRIIPANDLHSFVGCLETLKIELADAAAMAPALMLDGSTIDPAEQSEYIDDEWDDPA